jgi:Zn-dependent metalloprotease
MLKTYLLVAGSFIVSTLAFAQSSNIVRPDRTDSWLLLEEESIQMQAFPGLVAERLSLAEGVHFGINDEWQDHIGMDHQRLQQMVFGVPVEGAIYIAHGRDGKAKRANGHVVRGDFDSPSPSVSSSQALEEVLEHFNDHAFYFEDQNMEAWIKEFTGDPMATFFPQGELVYVDEEYSTQAGNYRLAWKFDVFVKKEMDREIVFVDALNGSILFTQDGATNGCAKHDHADHSCGEIHSQSSMIPQQGSGYTRYSGIQSFVADSVDSAHYRLLDDTRGEGIVTLNAKRTTNVFAAEDFVDDDNFWDMRNAFFDEAALDAHWGAEETYDYWLNQYGWESYDGNGSRMISYIHWDVNWFNASWNGMFARYGDGSSTPLTYIDIVAHEFAHGLTGTTSGLIYRNESGALNESFSDIFGTAVEFEALGDSAFYSLGIPQLPFRDMSNPNRYEDPDTYLGDNWFTGTGDNGGVHVNSGVQNFWWYLLVNGGSGVNDNGQAYQVDSLGMDIATAIAFRNLTTYLTPSSNYFDARLGALQAASDLYGPCSYEVEQVAKAWAAVGVGSPEVGVDLELVAVELPKGNCGLGSQEQLSATLEFNPTGCDLRLEEGGIIYFGYQVNDQAPVEEEVILPVDLIEGESYTHDFLTPADLSETGLYEIKFWISSMEDKFGGNDTIAEVELKKPVSYTLTPSNLGFRNFRSTLDSFYSVAGANADAKVSTMASRPQTPGILGFLMTGDNDRPRDLDRPRFPEEVFEKNESYGSKLCVCVDASNWMEVYLAFDHRQTYSSYHEQVTGLDLPQLVSTMRVSVDGEQIGDHYFPRTTTQDPWVRDTVDLSAYAGMSFEVCFEGRHFIDRQTDVGLRTGTAGDNTFLDNITIYDPLRVSTNDLDRRGLDVYPNPGNGEVTLSLVDEGFEVVKAEVRDVQGRVIKTLDANVFIYGRAHIFLDDLASGVYYIVISGQGSSATARWIKI